MSNVTTYENIDRKSPYIEEREKSILDTLFGTFDPSTNQFVGGYLDATKYPDLFKIPEYQIAAQDPTETFAVDALNVDANEDGIPDWLGRYQDYFDKSEGLLGITGEGGASDQFKSAADVLDEAKSYYGDVGEADRSAVELLQAGAGTYDPTSTEYGVSKYMSPYEDAVLAQMEQDIERQGDVSRKKTKDQAIAAGAFGGSRQGLQQAEVERGIADAKAKASANIRSKAYENALNASMTGYEKAQGRALDAGRLMGGLGQSYGGIGSALGGLGSEMTGAAGTAADIGRVYGSMSPADLAFLTGVGEQDRQYRQDVIDTERLEGMRNTEQYLYPLNVGMGFLSGTPSSQISGAYYNAQQPQTNPMIAGLGAYTAMQGINS